jgi:hypothetical protein
MKVKVKDHPSIYRKSNGKATPLCRNVKKPCEFQRYPQVLQKSYMEIETKHPSQHGCGVAEYGRIPASQGACVMLVRNRRCQQKILDRCQWTLSPLKSRLFIPLVFRHFHPFLTHSGDSANVLKYRGLKMLSIYNIRHKTKTQILIC